MHDPPILSLAEADCQMLEGLVMQSIGCGRKLREGRHCAANVRTTKHTGEEHLSKNALAAKALFSFESFVFRSILDRTRCQIEQISNVALVQWRFGLVG